MNLDQIINKIKEDRILQIIIGFSILFFLFFIIFVIKPIFLNKPQKSSQTKCYNITLKIWSPFKKEDFSSLISELSSYCIYFELEEKSLEDTKKDLFYALASDSFPDIVYLDNDFINRYPDLFATPTPVNIESLVAYYNKDILNYFQLEKPKTIDELKIFFQKIRELGKENFYPAGLGTREIRNRKEIILTLMTLNSDYKRKENFRQNFSSALDFYNSFTNPQSEFFAYVSDFGDDLKNFAEEKLMMFIGFYKDKKEILSLNPRLNYEISFLPNTFPPKMRIYSQIFYFTPVKKSKNLKITLDFLDWFYKYKLKKFTEIFDLVPAKEDIVIDDIDKKIVFESANNFGETFDFLNKEIIFKGIDEILNSWQNKNEVQNIIDQIYFSL